MVTGGSKDRREHPRYDATGSACLLSGSQFLYLNVKNISKGGALFTSSSEVTLRPGQRCFASIDVGARAAKLDAEVVRIDRGGVAVRWTGDGEGRREIDDIVVALFEP